MEKKCATCECLDAHPPKFTCTLSGEQFGKGDIETIFCEDWKLRVTTASEGIRPVGERKTSVDIDRVAEFSQAMAKKWSKGRTEYGTEMRFDPLDEAMNEAVDLANYSMEIYFRLMKLKETVKGLTE